MSNIFDLFKSIEKKTETKPVTHIVVGLGNPGQKYEKTRHNAGFIAIDAIAKSLGVKIDRAKYHALICECEMGGARVLLMKPETFMNNSGVAIGEAANFYKIPPENIIVLCDEISFAPGKMRIRRRGSAGGHNGLKSIIAHLSSEDFPRFKLGVGAKPSPDYDLAAWVLSEFSKEEQSLLFDAFGCVSNGLRLLLDGKFEEAQQLCNSHDPQTQGKE